MARNSQPNLFNLDPTAFKLSQSGNAFKRLKEAGAEKQDVSGIAAANQADLALTAIRDSVAREQSGFQRQNAAYNRRQNILENKQQEREGKATLSIASTFMGPFGWIAKMPGWVNTFSPMEYELKEGIANQMDKIGGPIEDIFGKESDYFRTWGPQYLQNQQALSGDILQGVGSFFEGAFGDLLDGKSDNQAVRNRQVSQLHQFGSGVAGELFAAIRKQNPNATSEELHKQLNQLVSNELFRQVELPGEAYTRYNEQTGLNEEMRGESSYTPWYMTKLSTGLNKIGSSEGRFYLDRDSRNEYIPQGYSTYVTPYVERELFKEEYTKRKAAAEEAKKQLIAQRETRMGEIEADQALIPSSGQQLAGTSLYQDDLVSLIQGAKGK